MTNVTYTHSGLYDSTAQPTLLQSTNELGGRGKSLFIVGRCEHLQLVSLLQWMYEKAGGWAEGTQAWCTAPVERPEPEPLLKLSQEIVLRARRPGRRNRGQLKRSLSPNGPPTLVTGLTTGAAEGERQNSIERILEPRMKILYAGILHTSR